MVFAKRGYLLTGSDTVFLDKEHLINNRIQLFKEVEIYLSEKEITDLYNRMLKAKRGKQK